MEKPLETSKRDVKNQNEYFKTKHYDTVQAQDIVPTKPMRIF